MTSFSYNSSTQTTTVTDALGQTVTLTYDASDRLKQYTLASGQVTKFTYDSASDNLKWIDPSTNTTYYAYDSNNNLIRQEDNRGDTVSYTYDSTTNALLTETRWYGRDATPSDTTNDATDGHTTHYIYDSENHLHFIVSPLGEVTEYRYDAFGNRTASIVYRDQATYTGDISESALNAWVTDTSKDESSVLRSDFTYDFRGNLKTATTYESANSSGAWITTSTKTVVTYTYDQSGYLLNRQTSPNTRVEQFFYDGLWRLTKSIDLANLTTNITFDDSSNTTTVQLADGLQKVSTYNYAGQLVSYTEQGSGITTATMGYTYDALGRLLMVTDALGNSHYYLRDSVGRLTANIAADGSIIEYGYDASDRLVKTVRYVNTLSPTQLASLHSETTPLNPDVSTVRPTADANDVWEWRVYDSGNRLVEILDSAGDATKFTYDGASNLLSTQTFVNVVSATTVAGFKTTTPTAQSTPTTSAADRFTRNFFDEDGRLVGVLDGNGYFTQYRYDAAGEKIEITAYATVVPSTDRAAGTFSQLLTDVGTSTSDRHARSFYDDRGLLRVTLDATLRPCEYVYDEAGRLLRKIEYAGTIANPTGDRLSDALTQISASGLGSNNATRNSWHVYDTASGRLVYDISSIGVVTRYDYDDTNLNIKTTRFKTTRTTTSSPSQTTMNSWVSSHTTSSGAITDRITRTIYDIKGRVAYTVDALGYVTKYAYDVDDQKVTEIRYADAYSIGDTDSAGSIDTLIGSPSTAIQTAFAYDADGRLIDVHDGLNICTHYDYDGTGQLIKKTLAYGITGEASETDYVYDPAGRLQSETTASGTDDASQTMYLYNGMGDLVQKTQAPGKAEETITVYAYDAGGRLTSQTVASGTTYSFNTSGVLTGTATSYGSGDASTTAYGYNAFGEVTDRAVASGSSTDASTTHYDRDNFGRVTAETAGYGASEASVTTYAYDAFDAITDMTRGAGATDTTTTTVTHYVYDNAGRLLTRTDAYGVSGEALTTTYTYDSFDDALTAKDGLNYTTTYTYDSDGNVLTSVRPIDATTMATTTNTYDAFGNLLTTTDAQGGVSYFFYDKDSRLTLTIDPERFATATGYNNRGEVTSVKRYFTRVTGTITPGVAPTPTANSSEDATTSFARDFQGRVYILTDAMGFTEVYTYDDLNNRLTVQNKLGGVVTYTYTRRNQVKTQSTPMDAVKADGTVEASVVVNTYQYDLRGNLKQMVEAAGLAEARTTSYTYDKLDRLTVTTQDSVKVVDPNDLKTVSTVTPTETNVYNVLGQLIETIDAAGSKTFLYYDHCGNKVRLVRQTDATHGQLSRLFYDLDGNVTEQRVYGDAVTLPSSPGGTLPAPVNGSNYRGTTYTYDRQGRLLTTSVTNLLTGAWDSTASTYTTNSSATVTVTNVYDLDGNLVQQTDGNGNSVFYYYDKLNRKIAEVDQANYLTAYIDPATGNCGLDADGNVLQETRFATALASAPATTSDPNSLVASITTHTGDRITTFTYDKNGRRLSETRANVAAWTVDSSSGALSAASSTDSTVSYTYNGLGEVTKKTEANNVVYASGGDHNLEDWTSYTYDVFGRQLTVTNPLFTIYDGTSDQQVTTEKYDGLNNLVRTVEGSHITTYNYDYTGSDGQSSHAGRLVSTTDANGFVTNYAYDIAGRTLKVSYDRAKSDGTTVTEAQATRYDAIGRVVYQAMASYDSTTTNWTFGDSSQTQYDIYGEVSARGVNGMWQETFAYDSGGRMWKSTAGDGVTRLYFYDGNGKQTLAIASDGAALQGGYAWSTLTTAQAISLLTAGGAHAIGSHASGHPDDSVYAVAGMLLTITGYDARGQAVTTREPYRQLSTDSGGHFVSGNDIVRARSYNAFGEVSSQTDARGNTTSFAYNTMGKLIAQTGPAVSYTGETGLIHTSVNPVTRNYYDISGRLIGVVDANHGSDSNPLVYASTRTLLSGTGHDGSDPLVRKQFFPDGSSTENKYDKHFDLRTSVDGVGKTESYIYDKMHRLTEQDHQIRTSDSGTPQLKDFYTYDGLGHRLTHTNSQLTSSVKETTDYDLQGRVTKMVDMGGNTTTYSYSWSSTLATDLDTVNGYGVHSTTTGGFGAFGGWTKTTTNTSGLTETLKTDYFGRLVDKTNFGGVHYSYAFDAAGRLGHQASSYSGENVAYTYFNTGLVASAETDFIMSVHPADGPQQDAPFTVLSTFGYDVDGNRNYESQLSTQVNQRNNDPITGDPRDPITRTNWNGSATIAYDALNRMTTYTESNGGGFGSPTISWEYDLNGNIRVMNSSYTAADFTAKSQTYWYKYDAMNRFVTTKGELKNGSTVIDWTGHLAGTTGTISRSTGGTDITYNGAGQRATATGADGTETYGYTEDGYLKQVTIGSTVRATYTRDAMGRVLEDDEYDSSGNLAYSRYSVTYDPKSEVTEDYVKVIRPDTTPGGTNHTWITHTTYSYTGGLLTSSSATVTKDGANQADQANTTTNTYVWWDNAEQASQSIATTAYTWTSTWRYDPQGHLFDIRIADGNPRTITFVTNAQNEILSRLENVDSSSYGDPQEMHFYRNGIQVGDVSNNGTSDVDYATSIAEHTAIPANGTNTAMGVFGYSGSGSSTYSGVNAPTYTADFDQSYDPINGLNYESTSSRYTVVDGDTLQSIAQQIWGDSSFWYMLADANGLSGSETLVAGRDLIVPNKVHNAHNSSDVFKVYDPNQALGNNSPSAVQPSHNHNCGVFGQILLVVIAVAVTILTSGALAAGPDESILAGLEALSSGSLGFGTTVAIGAEAGIAGSVASQAVGLATGIQKSFSWKGVAESAVGGAVGAGLGFEIPGSGVGATVLRGVAGNMITQGVEVATGLEKKFDWAGVAAAGVGAFVTWGVGQLLPGAAQHGSFTLGGQDIPVDIPATAFNRYVSGAAGLIAGAATRSVVNGSDFGDNILATLPDIIGQTLGDIVADRIVASGTHIAEAHGSSDAGETVQSIVDKYAAEYESEGGDASVSGADAANSATAHEVLTSAAWKAAPGYVPPDYLRPGDGPYGPGYRMLPGTAAEVDIADLPSIGDGPDFWNGSEYASKSSILDRWDNQFSIAAYNTAASDLSGIVRGVVSAFAHPIDTVERIVGAAANTLAHPFDSITGAYRSGEQVGRTIASNYDAAVKNHTLPAFFGAALGHAVVFAGTVVTDTEELEGVEAAEASVTAERLRNLPGIATSSTELKPAIGVWLDARIPAPIPSQIADALVGQQFSRFGDLRAAIWKAIAEDDDLNGGFSAANLGNMEAGNAPFAPRAFQTGEGDALQRFNLHHVEPIENGGAVYDLSNLLIVSPKVHLEIHYPTGP